MSKETKEDIFNTEDLSELKCAGCERTIKTWHLCTVCFRRIMQGGVLKQKPTGGTSFTFDDVEKK